MQYRLRTLLIVLALGPPALAGLSSLGFLAWVEVQQWRDIQQAIEWQQKHPDPPPREAGF